MNQVPFNELAEIKDGESKTKLVQALELRLDNILTQMHRDLHAQNYSNEIFTRQSTEVVNLHHYLKILKSKN